VLDGPVVSLGFVYVCAVADCEDSAIMLWVFFLHRGFSDFVVVGVEGGCSLGCGVFVV